MEFRIRFPSLGIQNFEEIEKGLFNFPIPKPMFNPFGISKFMNEMLNSVSQYDEIDIHIKPKEGRISYCMKGLNGETKGEFNHEFFISHRKDVKPKRKERIKKSNKKRRDK